MAAFACLCFPPLREKITNGNKQLFFKHDIYNNSKHVYKHDNKWCKYDTFKFDYKSNNLYKTSIVAKITLSIFISKNLIVIIICTCIYIIALYLFILTFQTPLHTLSVYLGRWAGSCNQNALISLFYKWHKLYTHNVKEKYHNIIFQNITFKKFGILNLNSSERV